MRDTKKFVVVTMLSAMAITLNIIESIFIGNIAFGIRVGLANIIAIITIYVFGIKEMLIVNIMRVVIGNLLRGLIFGTTFWIALSGILLSSLFLIITYKLKSTILFSSIISSIMHSMGQVLCVLFIYNQVAMLAIVPYLLLGSIPMGIITGIVADKGIQLIKKNFKF